TRSENRILLHRALLSLRQQISEHHAIMLALKTQPDVSVLRRKIDSRALPGNAVPDPLHSRGSGTGSYLSMLRDSNVS
ncbi:MAG TPA: hypothetical protein VHM70_20530, partial [Polyangiaceae bacterium]|nr:hypothetical protein [Polyangiaceae bacterium]